MVNGTLNGRSSLERIFLHKFEVGAAFAWAFIGANYLLDRTSGARSAIGQSLPFWEIAWSSCYILGGVLLVVGIVQASQRLRVGGLIIMGTGLLMQGVAALAVAPLEPRDLVYSIYSLLCWTQAWASYKNEMRRS